MNVEQQLEDEEVERIWKAIRDDWNTDQYNMNWLIRAVLLHGGRYSEAAPTVTRKHALYTMEMAMFPYGLYGKWQAEALNSVLIALENHSVIRLKKE